MQVKGYDYKFGESDPCASYSFAMPLNVLMKLFLQKLKVCKILWNWYFAEHSPQKSPFEDSTTDIFPSNSNWKKNGLELKLINW